MRKNSLRSVFIAVLFSLSIIMIGMAFGTFRTVKAEYVADLFTVEASAETRTSEPYGLRFTIRLGANEKASIASGEKTLGAMIVPYFYLEDYESYKADNPSYTGGYYEYFSNVKKKMIHFTYDDDVIYADAEHNCYRVKISILNVKYENLNLDFVAIGYLRTGEGTSPSDYEYTKVGSAYARSIAYVAGQAVGDLDGEAKSSLQEIVTLAELQKKGVTKSGNTYTYNDTDYTLSEVSDEIFDFIKNGSTSYRLVIPNDVTGAAANGTHKIFTTARQELKNLLAAATGINILEWTDEQATSNAGAYDGSQKYISLGKTEVLTAAGVTYDALDETGYALKIKNGSLFIIGETDVGVLNGVYAFLRQQFGFETYAADEMYIEKGITNASFNITEGSYNADITWRIASSAVTARNETFARRLGYSSVSDYMIDFGGTWMHNYLAVVDPDAEDPEDTANTLYQNHPDWFSGDKKQLCLTRDFDNLKNYVVAKMKAAISASDSAFAIGFTQEDDGGWCSCGACGYSENYYGSKSAAAIKFINACAVDINAWLNANNSDRDITLYIIAYQDTIAPPTAHLDELTLEDNVAIWYCPIYANGYYSYDHAKNSTGISGGYYDDVNYADQIAAWKTLCGDKLMLWSYSYYYKAPLYPYYDFSDIANTYSYIADNAYLLFDEARYGSVNPYDFESLKSYIRAKLCVDVDADIDALTDEFFDKYYKAASDTMKTLYTQFNERFAYLVANNLVKGKGKDLWESTTSDCWPRATLNGYIDLLCQAYDDIKYLKYTDTALYETIEKRICLDSLSIRALYYKIYGSDPFTASGYDLFDDCNRFGISISQPIWMDKDEGVSLKEVYSDGTSHLTDGREYTNALYINYTLGGEVGYYQVTFNNAWYRTRVTEYTDYHENLFKYSALRISGANAADLETLSSEDTPTIAFSIYLRSSDYPNGEIPSVYINSPYEGADDIYDLKDLENSDVVKLYDANGNQAFELEFDQWMQVLVLCSDADIDSKTNDTSIYAETDTVVYITNAFIVNGNANYTIKYYKYDNNSKAEAGIADTVRNDYVGRKAKIDTYPTLDGYMPYTDPDYVAPVIESDSSSVYEAYYKRAVQIENSGDKAYLYPYETKSNKYGNPNIETTLNGGVYTVNNSEDGATLRIVGVDADYIASHGIRKLTFDMLVEEDVLNNVVRIYRDGAPTKAASLQLAGNLNAANDYIRLYDANGNYAHQLYKNVWTTVEINLAGIEQLEGVARVNVELSILNSVKLKNVTFSTESFDRNAVVIANSNGNALFTGISANGRIGVINIENAGTITDANSIAIEDAYKVTFDTYARNNALLRIAGVGSDYVSNNSIQSLRFKLYYPSGDSPNIVLYYNDSNAASIHLSGNMSGKTACYRVYDETGHIVSNNTYVPGKWYTVVMDLTSATAYSGCTMYDTLNVGIRANAGVSFYIADVKLSKLALGIGEDAITIGNSDGRAVLYALAGSSGNPNYGNSAQTFVRGTSDAPIGGRTDYIAFRSTSASALRIVGVDSAYLSANGYSVFTMKIFIPVGYHTKDLLITAYRSGSTANKAYYLSQIPNTWIGYYYDEDGNTVTAAEGTNTSIHGKWLTLQYTLNSIDTHASGAGVNLEFNIKNANGTALYDGDPKGCHQLYFADVAFTTGNGLAEDTVQPVIKNADNTGRLTYTADGVTPTIQFQQSGDYIGAYKFTAEGNYFLQIRNVSDSYIKNNGYKKLKFDIYSDSISNILLSLYDKGGVRRYGSLQIAGNVSAMENWVSIYRTGNGASATNLTNGTWYTVEINLEDIYNDNFANQMYLRITGSTTYIKNIELVK